MPEPLDILLCQKFLPEFGGSIRWMYEVYRRWPAPVEVITHDYYAAPPRTPEFPHQPVRPAAGDDVTDPNLKLDRRDIFINNWGLDRPHRVLRYARMTRAVAERLVREPRGRPIRVHAIHAVPEVLSLLPVRWRYGRRLRVICYAHGEEVTACSGSRQLRFLMRRAHGVIDLMLANSRYTAGVLAPHIDPRKVRVLNPGVELAEFAGAAEAGAAWRRQRGYEQRLLIASIGRLDPRKNHAAMIDAVARLAPRHPDLLYVIASEGRAMPALREQAQRLGVGDRIVFLGAIGAQEKLALYGACDVFAMPAIQDGTDVEGFGMVFLEAAACGKPVLAGSAGGQPDAVVNGQTGLIVEGANHDAVAAATHRLLSDAALRRRLGEQGRIHAARFDWPAVVQRTLQLVEEMERKL